MPDIKYEKFKVIVEHSKDREEVITEVRAPKEEYIDAVAKKISEIIMSITKQWGFHPNEFHIAPEGPVKVEFELLDTNMNLGVIESIVYMQEHEGPYQIPSEVFIIPQLYIILAKSIGYIIIKRAKKYNHELAKKKGLL